MACGCIENPTARRNETVLNDGLLRYLGFLNAERIVLTSPEALHEVLVTKNYSFPKPASLRETAGRFLGLGLILSEGDAHKMQRRSMNSAFAPRNIKALYSLLWENTREMVDRTTVERGDGMVEVEEWASRITLDLIGVAGLGRDFGAVQDEKNKLVKTYNVVFQPSSQAQMLHLIESLVPAWILTTLPIKFNSDIGQAARSIRETCREIISSKQKKLTEKKLDDMDIMSEAIRTGTFTDDGLIDQAMTLLAAGHDTTGAAFTWGVYLLAKHPEVQQRLRQEIRQRLPPLKAAKESPISSVNIDIMPYLQAVCSEILRFYAPVPQTLREAAEDTTITGQFIPKGTRIVIAPWATDRASSLWGPDAHVFSPDRWLYESAHGGAAKRTMGAGTSDKMLTILVIGKGGREHALAWKLGQAKSVDHVFVFPGNAGTQEGASNISNISNLTGAIADYHGLAQRAKELKVGLVVVGPDEDVVKGIDKFFRDVNIPCFAPSLEAAELEGSKVFAKGFMARNNIPTAEYRSFDKLEDALSYVRAVDHRIVIKADGLAAGKGVILPETKEEALEELRIIMEEGKFSTAGSSVVIEEYMEGDEISLLTFSDGETFYSLPPGQDHKRALEGNKGPNTGGMGVYSPVPFVTEQMLNQIDESILKPTFAAMKAEGRCFMGLLFTGIMFTPFGPKVIEYNVRFGDPETQSSMLLISPDTDLAAILLSCTNGTLSQTTLNLRPGFVCNVVIASGGYPGKYETGKAITLQSPTEDVVIFHAGTRKDEKDGVLRTAGGRVFSVAAYGDTIQEAIRKAYKGVECVSFEPMVFRKDIASRYATS
ncbi:hypothetical protein F53441_10760 [Fusarium austroafricanum]|uniref:phosphoribosylamine--glycine ligase n=1 Tax=Fusarium austroafricanum TaxID=2364996 RepID=A0A8H4K690_9HYPO|nr:hypothetical protein F53441_10760 [Fusarium austroafricanum]